jgi:2-dehydropantoate 2-reductase
LPAADFVLFCVKTYDVAEAMASLQPVVQVHTILLTLQNGVDTALALQEKFPDSTVLAGITRTGSTLIAPGVIEQPTMDRVIELGSLASGRHQGPVERVRQLLAQADIPVVVSPNIQRSLWEKLIYISAFAGLSTLIGLSPKQILAQGPTRALYRAVMEETAAVARAAGVEVAPDIVERTMQYLDAEGDLGSASMAVDFQRRQRIEIEAINGAVVRHGKRLGVPTPVNETIYAAVVVMDAYQRAAS